ncbi:hypothetical protein D3C79_614940 [compost metagenome]
MLEHLAQVALVLPTQIQVMAQAGKRLGLDIELLRVAIAKTRVALLATRHQLKEERILGGQRGTVFKLAVGGKVLQRGLHQALAARDGLEH